MVYFCLVVCLMGINGKSTSWLWRFLLPFLSLTGTTAPELGVAYVRVCACMLLSRSIINAVCFCCLFRCHPILPRGCIFDDPGKARRALRFFSCITVDCGMNHHLTAIYPIWSPSDNIISMLSVFYCGKRRHRTGRLTDTMVWVFARLVLRKIQTAALSPCPCLYYILYSQEHGKQGELAKFELIKTLK